MSEQLEQFLQKCVAMKHEIDLQASMEQERIQQENLDAWSEVLEMVRERLPVELREAVELPYPLDLDYGPDHQAYVIVRINGAANLRVYAHPGEFRYPDKEDYYSRIPALEVGSEGRLIREEDGTLITIYSWWQPYSDLEMAVADAYEESLRPAAPEPQPETQVKVETPLCPLLMLANDSDWQTINNCGTSGDQIKRVAVDDLQCKGKACAWWVRGRCAIAVLGG